MILANLHHEKCRGGWSEFHLYWFILINWVKAVVQFMPKQHWPLDFMLRGNHKREVEYSYKCKHLFRHFRPMIVVSLVKEIWVLLSQLKNCTVSVSSTFILLINCSHYSAVISCSAKTHTLLKRQWKYVWKEGLVTAADERAEHRLIHWLKLIKNTSSVYLTWSAK